MMADKTKIQWADATWNPIVGCSLVSPGCTHCYAMRVAWRLANNPKTPHYAGTAEVVKGKPVWTGKLSMASDRVVGQPLKWRRPRRIFVNSEGDLFHEDAPNHWIDRVVGVMHRSPQHSFLVLTKRAERMHSYCRRTPARTMLRLQSPYLYGLERWPLPNVWIGVSAEDQRRAQERLPLLRDTPAALRFLSAEPLLGPLDLPAILGPKLAGLDWVIAGGESGPGARAPDPDWFRRLRDDCAAAGVPFFFKQWGEWLPAVDCITAGIPIKEWRQTSPSMARIGKRRTGNHLDGCQHLAFPEG